MTDTAPQKNWNDDWMDQEVPDPVELLVNPEAMRDYVVRRSRMPFQEVLARLLQAEPTLDQVKALAKDSPEKWTKMVRDMASLSGYKDGVELDVNLGIKVHDMSDAELLHQFENLQQTLVRIANGEEIEDAEYEEVPAIEDKSTVPDFLT